MAKLHAISSARRQEVLDCAKRSLCFRQVWHTNIPFSKAVELCSKYQTSPELVNGLFIAFCVISKLVNHYDAATFFPCSSLDFCNLSHDQPKLSCTCRSQVIHKHGGCDKGGHGPSNNLVGGAIMYLPPQYLLKKSSTSGFRNIT